MSGTTAVSKEIEFDAGHRIASHTSLCNSPHGHRYRVSVTCEGGVVDDDSAEDNGMVVDFGMLKEWMTAHIHDELDHSFIVHEHDEAGREMLEVGAKSAGQDWRIVVFPYVPTAENIARWCWEQLEPVVAGYWRDSVVLTLVEVWETPSSRASYRRH